MTTPMRFGLSYVAVLAVMVGWWLGMKQAATVGPVLLLVVAYTVPIAAWWVVVAGIGGEKVVHRER
jgi:uncharacterized membrane protein